MTDLPLLVSALEEGDHGLVELRVETRASSREDRQQLRPGGAATFLIAPVRGLSPDAHAATVAALEADGYSVYWPARDTDQSDPTGLAICRANADAIARADVVHVLWDGQSQGCVFDLGVAFALNKRVIPLGLPEPSAGKSFQNMVRAWADG